jgi:hypothetical protein
MEIYAARIRQKRIAGNNPMIAKAALVIDRYASTAIILRHVIANDYVIGIIRANSTSCTIERYDIIGDDG